MLRNPCSQIFRPNKKNFTEIQGFKKWVVFRFLKNQGGHISLLSQPIFDRFFRTTSHLKEKKKLNIMGYFSSLKHDIKSSKNVKNRKWKNPVLLLFDKNHSARLLVPQILQAYLVKNSFL